MKDPSEIFLPTLPMSANTRFWRRFAISWLMCMMLFRITASGQELPVYQLYLWQPALINPAVTGCAECAGIRLIDRHQWPGAFRDAPRTQVLMAEKAFPVDKDRFHGLGLQLFNDVNGVYRQMSAGVAYTFHITLDRIRNLRLGFGLMPSVYQSTYDERDFTRMNDPVITWAVEKEIRPDVSTGVYLYSDRFYAGLSAVQLLGFTSTLNASRTERGYFLHGGIHWPLTGSWSAQPGMAVKYLSGQLQTDLNIQVTHRDNYRAMLSYRHQWQESVGRPSRLLIYLGMDYNHLSFGYGYDLGLSSMLRYGYGSHEFMVGYRLCRQRLPCRVYQ